MVLSRIFGALRIRNTLTIIYSLVFITIFATVSIILFFEVRKIISQRLERDLEGVTNLIVESVRTAVQVSLRSHLRTIAISNLEKVKQQYGRFSAGEITEKLARSIASQQLLSQKVGKSGYVYVIDSRGTAIIHPNKEVEGNNYAERPFIQEMIRNRQGYITYLWQNPDEPKPLPKAQFVVYFEPWDWIIAATSYRTEFSHLIDIGDFREQIGHIRFGKSGYAVVMNSRGDAILHPHISGNLLQLMGPEFHPFLKEVIQSKNGKISYLWQNPGERSARRKFAIYRYMPDYDWIVLSSVYLDDFYSPLITARN